MSGGPTRTHASDPGSPERTNHVKRIGLMGCGTVADYGHLPVLRDSEELELHAVYDPDEAALLAAKKKFDVPEAYTDVERFLDSGIDAVSITSPAPCHSRNAMDAARHGKHILCEKPLAMTEDECRRMIDAAEKARVMLFTGFDYRFSPVAQKIKELVEQNAVGEVRSLRLINIWNCHGKYVTGPDGRTVEQARRAGRMHEGGPLVDCGVHLIDLGRWWVSSEVARWSAAGAWVDEYEAPDHVFLHMDHVNGVHTMVEISFSYCHTAKSPISDFTYQLIGTEGVIRYDRPTGVLEVRNTESTQQFTFDAVKNFAGMYSRFARALETGEPGDLPSAEDGLIAIRLAREATESLIRSRTRPASS